jgi:hypothetical protein
MFRVPHICTSLCECVIPLKGPSEGFMDLVVVGAALRITNLIFT